MNTISLFGYHSIHPSKVSKSFSFGIHFYWKIINIGLGLLVLESYLGNEPEQIRSTVLSVSKSIIIAEIPDYGRDQLFTRLAFVTINIYILLLYLLLFYVLFNSYRNTKLHPKLANIWKFTIWILPYISFSISAFSIAIIHAYISFDLVLYGEDSVYIPVWAGFNLLFCVVMTILSLKLFLIPVKQKNKIALKTGSIFLVEFLEKLLIYLVYLIAENGDSKFFFLICLQLGCCCVRLYLNLTILPYYSLKVMRNELVMQGIELELLVINFFVGIGSLLTDSKVEFGLFLWVLLLPISVKTSLSLSKNLFQKVFEGEKKDNIWKVLHFSHVMKNFVKKGIHPKIIVTNFDEKQLLVYGKNQEIKNQMKLDMTSIDIENSACFSSYLDHILSTMIKKNPDSIELKAQFMINSIHNKQAFIEVSSMMADISLETHQSILDSILVLFFKEILGKKLQEDSQKEGENLDVSSFISITENFSSLKDLINLQIKYQIQFWSIYKSQAIEFSEFLKINAEIEKLKAKINAHWNFLHQVNNRRYLLPYLTYGMYLNLVSNRPAKSLEFMKHNANSLSKLENTTYQNILDNYTIYDPLTSYIEVSGDKKDLGTIKFVSPSFLQGYNHKRELLTSCNLKVIIPPFYRSSHDKVMSRYFRSGEKKMIGKTRETFILDGDGFLIYSLLHVKVNPYYDMGLNFIGIIRPKLEDYHYITIRSNGYIDATSSKIAEFLNLDSGSIHITEFCPEYDVYHEMIRKLKKTSDRPEDSNPEVDFFKSTTSLYSKQTSKYLSIGRFDSKDATTDRSSRRIRNNQSKRTMTKISLLNNEQMESFLKDIQLEGVKLNYNSRTYEEGFRYYIGFTKLEIEVFENEWMAILHIRDFREHSGETGTNRQQTQKIKLNNFYGSHRSPFVDVNDLSAMAFSNISEGNDAEKVENYTNIFDFALDKNDKDTAIPSTVRETKNLLSANREEEPLVDSKQVIVEHERSEDLDVEADRKLNEKKLDVKFEKSQRTSTSSYRRNFKAFEMCLDHKYINKKNLAFVFLFFIVVIIGQTIIISQNLYISTSFEDIKKKGDIVITAYFRADNADLALWAARLLNTAILGLYDTDSSSRYDIFMGYLKNNMENMRTTNYQLENQVSIIENSLQIEFYKKNVKFYEVSGIFSTTGSYQEMNAFEAIDHIYTTILHFKDDPFAIKIPSNNLYIDYLITNSMNSLMLEFERTVILTQGAMTNAISSFTSQLEMISGIGLGFISLYIVGSIYIFKQLCFSVEGFAKYFMKITDKEIGFAQNRLKDFQKGLLNNFVNLKSDEDSPRDFEKIATNKKYNKDPEKKLNFKKIMISYFLIILKIWPVFLFMGFAIIQELKHAYPAVEKMSQLQSQMVQVMYYMYITDITFVSLIDLVLYNGTTIVREKSIEKEIKSTTFYSGDTENYVRAFRNTDGSFDDYVFGILFNTSCSDTKIVPSDYYTLCSELSGGTGFMSLIQTNPIYEKVMQEFADSWIQSVRTSDLIPQFMNRYVNYVAKVNNIQNFFIVAIQEAVNQGFFDYIESEKYVSTRNIVLFSIITEFLAALIFIFALSNVINQENMLKKLMHNIPPFVFTKNRNLKSHLIQMSGKLGESLKKF